ncbi:hypothetical protein F5X98DRAFT_185596 [Xylaria grammica]|nr:hypothetical protein F5X98DRAFT_185596 [Xylaria grammica]
MSLDTYEMEGSLAFLNAPYEISSSNQVNSYHLENLGRQIPPHLFNIQPDLGVPHPVYQPELATRHTQDPSCWFRSEVLDDCARARFYARMVELYLIEDEHPNAEFNCPLEACGAHFNNPKDMLRHLKHCKSFAEGKFWCPTCLRSESFKTRSGRRCSWDKDHIGQKLLQKSKSVLQSFGNKAAASQQKSNHALCVVCSAELSDLWTQSGGDPAPLNEAQLTQSATPAISFNTQELAIPSGQFYELESSISGVSELSELSSSENSLSQSYPRSVSHAHTVSELSSPSTSPHGGSISATISPSSSTHEELPATTLDPNPANIVDKVTRRVADASNRIMNQRCTSLYSNFFASPRIQSLTPALDVSNSQTFATPSPLMSTLTQHASFRTPPRLRLRTAQGLATPAPDPRMVDGSQTFSYHSTTARNPRVTSLPAGIGTQQLNIEDSFLSPFTSGGDSFATQQADSPATNQSPPVSAVSTSNSNSQSPQTNLFSDKNRVECRECHRTFKKKAYLNKHAKTHGLRHLVWCTLCNTPFTRKDNCTSHHKRLHCPPPPKRRRGSPDMLRSAPQPKKKGLRAGGPETP